MGRLERIFTAVAAAAVIAFSSLTGWAYWMLWRQPWLDGFEALPRGIRWNGGAFTAEVTFDNGALEQLILWRGAD